MTRVSETAQQAGRELSVLEVTKQALVLQGRDRPPGELGCASPAHAATVLGQDVACMQSSVQALDS